MTPTIQHKALLASEAFARIGAIKNFQPHQPAGSLNLILGSLQHQRKLDIALRVRAVNRSQIPADRAFEPGSNPIHRDDQRGADPGH